MNVRQFTAGHRSIRRDPRFRLSVVLVSCLATGLAWVTSTATTRAGGQQTGPPVVSGLHGPLDRLLEVYVRDGLVYYRALQSDRRGLDAYISSLNIPAGELASWDRDRQAAFWLNAYNALVLRTVIDHYPIRATAVPPYPRGSVHTVPGAFDRARWRIAGQSVTLDEIEKRHLAAFEDPRMFFAIGRGTVDGGRLRSEVFDAGRLEEQLTAVARDCVSRVSCANIDEVTGTLSVSPIFSWRQGEFVAAYAERARGAYAGRSPIELAVIGFIEPFVYASERDWLAQNSFKVAYATFDWRLNDLTGGPPP